MSYANLELLQARLSPQLQTELTDQTAGGVLIEASLEAALDDASADIDLALAGRYQTPLEEPATLLSRWCVELAAELLYLRGGREVPATIAQSASLTRRALQAIADGLVGLSGAQPRLGDFAAQNSRLDQMPTMDSVNLEDF